MHVFNSARIKLSLWYLLIIMIISISFSAFIYYGGTRELNRIVRVEQYHDQHPQLRALPSALPDSDRILIITNPNQQIIEQEKLRIFESLLVVNIFILLASSLAGYFLAGRTLGPIKNMVDEQNRFITDASHELNTPLTSLKTSIEVNLRDKNLNLEKSKGVLLSNLEEVNNLQALSAELIKITQYQKVNGNLNFEKIDIRKPIATAVSKVNTLAAKKKIKINVKAARQFVDGDARSLTELFTVLLDNAVKYSPNKKDIFVTADSFDSKVRVSVKDRGMGIDKEDLPLIFDRFYRADKSRTKQEVSGYGLGLSIAKRIVDLHNGTINAESEKGTGTTFTVVFPRSRV